MVHYSTKFVAGGKLHVAHAEYAFFIIATNDDPEEMPQLATSHQGCHWLLVSHYETLVIMELNNVSVARRKQLLSFFKNSILKIFH